MKAIRYFFIILIVAGILNLFKMYNLIDFDFVKYDTMKKVEINEDIKFQTENDNLTKLNDINEIDKEGLKDLNFKDNEIRNIIKYRKLVGYIDDIDKMKKVLKISRLDKLTIGNKKGKYAKHSIENLSKTELFWLGFTKKEIKIIEEILKENENKELKALDFIGRVNSEIIEKYMDF